MKTGVAFGDFIKTEKINRRDHTNTFGSSDFIICPRYILIPFFLILTLLILLVKLISLQLIQGAYYQKLSDQNRVRTTIVHAPRGIIFDRGGTPLVFNVPGFRKVQKQQNGQIKTQLLSRDKALRMMAQGEKNIEVDSLRQYPYRDQLAHVVGYIGQISKEELGQSRFQNYNGGDMLGKMGLEQEYEQKLKGIDGKKLIEVDSSGKTIRLLGQTDAAAGQNITSTLDIKLQQAGYNAMKDVKKGSLIVSNPQGEILAMISKPSFDPNLFTLDQSYKSATDSAYQSITQILTDIQTQPLLNRAISGAYPPGSTFKLVNAAAGLEDKAIDENYQVIDNGTIKIGQFSFSNWYFTQYGRTEGSVNVVKAIKRSNDIFFYKLAEVVGVDNLSAMAKKFGLGNQLGIDLAGEVTGLVPTPDWKKQTTGESWYLGDTYHYGIGQGYLLTTPLQVNGWTSAIVNAGVLYQPHLLKNSKFKIQNSKFLSEKTVSLIKEGMVEACSLGGVAWPLFNFQVKNQKLTIDNQNFFAVPQSTTSAEFADYRHVAIACKTGTAQHGDENTIPHAWITLFAPAQNPQIIVTVLAESSGEGSNVAAPIAKKVLEEWFSR